MSLTYIREYAEDGGIFSEADAQPGTRLTELMDRKRLTVKVALELVAALGDILAIAGEDGKTHGDPKIGMVRVDANGNIALEDFRDTRRTTRAPEPKPLGPPSDIYGLGVILQALLNTTPFGRVPKTEDAHDEAIVKKVMATSLGKAEGQGWTQELKEFMVSMMAHQPADRPSADDVAEVLGNAADSLDGENLGDWAGKTVKASATRARARSQAAPEEDLEGVRTVHQSPRPALPTLDEPPDTELAIPTIKRILGAEGLAGEEELGGVVELGFDGSLDETILDSPASADDYLGMAHETRIDALAVAPLSEDLPSFHEQETVLGRNLLRESAAISERMGQAPAKSVAEKTPVAKMPAPLEETLAAQSPPQGIIKGPAIPPPPPADRGPDSKKPSSKSGLIVGLVLIFGIGAYVSQQNSDPETGDLVALPGPIVDADPEAEKTEDTAVAAEDPQEEAAEVEVDVEAVEQQQPAPPGKTEAPPAPKPPAPVERTQQAPKPFKKAASTPKPKPKPTAAPAPIAEPAAEPAAEPMAEAPPYRIRLEIKGENRKITCGDGQRPEVTGVLNLTFDSIQYCRVEIGGGMGILNVAASGTYSCIQSGQVRCSKIR
jgi:hypothetical protein